MKTIIITISLSLALMLSGCQAFQNMLSSMYNLVNCDYNYNSISNLSMSGINMSKGLTPLMIPTVLSIIEGKASSIPLDFTLNLDVKNPNNGTAAFQALKYIISIDDIEVTNGNFNQAFSVGAGESKVLPMNIGLDIAKLMQNNSRSSIQTIFLNFLGLGDKASEVTVQLKPSFKVGEQTFTSPVYIPVSFSFGGKK